MKFSILLVAILLATSVFGGVADDLKQNTVVVTDGYGHGSGVMLTRGNRTFIWTACHVADIFQRSDGTYREVTIIQDGMQCKARVLRGGDYLYDRDFALLEIVGGSEISGNAHFYRAFDHIKLGHKIIHCGTPLCIDWNERLVTWGRVSSVDKMCEGAPLVVGRRLDHIDITGGPGCSGGPVVDMETGGIIGLLVMGSGPSMHIIEPTRYLYAWAAQHDCLWAFDSDVPLPNNISPWLSDSYMRECKERVGDIDKWGDPPPSIIKVSKAIIRVLLPKFWFDVPFILGA
jgi:S1-C subfamily serine protease